MKKLYLSLLYFILMSFGVNAQKISAYSELKPLSETELQKLASIPEYQFVTGDRAVLIPSSVDNSALPYFRPLFNQSGLECGQAASIGLNFTYEMNVARNLPGNVAQNQYATYFTYDFINGGVDAGVSFYESWEIVKRCGNPTVAEYGGLSAGGCTRWMTGYDKYYNAMHNRITELNTIKTDDVEGLNTVKNWIYNHCNNSTIGGLANIYIQYKTPDVQLPAGTPEAGKWVIITWGGSPNHALTLVGYNDSIRWDYNGDGQYTNNIDINGDGIVNVKDWEIGGFKLANTYGGINNWGDMGFSFVMYKTLADNLESGGIWNHSVNIVNVKQDDTPKLTYKVTVKHTSRNKIKLMAGVSQNPMALEPDALLSLPIFDFQGGDKYMQGGSTEADKTIEIGIDATPLLSEISPGQQAKFFFMLQENDPTGTATGQIVSCALVDYNGAITITPCISSNVPIVENGLTTLSIITTPNFNPPVIATTSLPEAKIYEPYSQQLNATGGTTDYKWKFKYDYNETPVPTPFPSVTAQQLVISNTYSGFAEVILPFEFPFYGKKYAKLYAHVDGYLMFQPDLMPWPFIIYEKTFFRNTRNISPYMSKSLTLFPSEGDGIWYQGDANSAIFRWKSSMYNSGSTTDLNFAAKIFPNGKIEFYYGNIISDDWVKWNAGISDGDGVNYHYAAITDSLAQPAANSMFRFTTLPFVTEMTLSDDGIFSGTPSAQYDNVPIKFYVEDNNTFYTTKTLNFSTKGINIVYSLLSGSDSIPEYGETAHLTAILTNIGNDALHNVILTISENDQYINLIDSTQNIGLLNPGQSVTIPDALSFYISESIPDGHVFNTVNQAIATEDIFTRTIPMTAFAAKVIITNIAIQDGNNNILMPGETGILNITVKNEGGSAATNVDALLEAIDPYIIVNQGSASIPIIDKYTSQNVAFQVSVAGNCPVGHIALTGLHLDADKNYSIVDSVYFNIGLDVEDFETGNFTRYPWQFSGIGQWSTTNVLPYEGVYCAQSPAIGDMQETSMYLELNVLTASEISFYRKVSSETNYDFLTFYIDGAEQGKWSGQVAWNKLTYPVAAGTRIFKWKYSKDINTVAGSDKAWVDYISWPINDCKLLIANAGTDNYTCNSPFQTAATVINADNMYWTSSGDGYFENYNTTNALYYPGTLDYATGSAILTIHALRATVPSVTDDMILTVLQSSTAYAGQDATICAGSGYNLAQAIAGNQLSLLWSTSGDGSFDNANILAPVYTPGSTDISNGAVTLTLTAFGPPLCNNASDNLILTINPAVITEAGADQTLPFGSSTQLNGTASGGTGSLSIQWQPAEKLIYANVLNPITLNLTETTQFTLQVSDSATQCNATDQMTVFIDNTTLGVLALANPSELCLGESSQLSALTGGGTGNYTYLWSSVPAGFASAISNPVVSPVVNTLYIVDVNDGSNNAQSSVNVMVEALALQPATPTGPTAVNVSITPVTAYNTSGSANSTGYEWLLTPAEAGNITQMSNSCQVNWNQLFDGTARLAVTGTNACGPGPQSEVLTIMASPTLGLADSIASESLMIWPNPTNSFLYIKTSLTGNCTVSLNNSQGKTVFKTCFLNRNEIVRLDLQELSKGIYLISVGNEKEQQVKKVVIKAD